MDIGDLNDRNCHQHLKVVTNEFRLQHPSPTSMQSYEFDVAQEPVSTLQVAVTRHCHLSKVLQVTFFIT